MEVPHYDQDRSDRTGCSKHRDEQEERRAGCQRCFRRTEQGNGCGEKITISGFGTFEIRERAERQGINPRTREPITIAASKSIVFKPGKALKDTL